MAVEKFKIKWNDMAVEKFKICIFGKMVSKQMRS
jgi:hypothetical protein